MHKTAGVLLLLLIGFATTARAQTGDLTLACKGTGTTQGLKPEPLSMGIIVNFTSRTVQGFGFPAPITDADDVQVSFEGSRSLVPIPVVWLLIYGLVAVVRWVKAGFEPV